VPGLRRTLASAACGLLLVSAASLPATAQTAYARFDLTSIQDTTFTFAVPRSSWVVPGLRGIAVDPTRGDELIAQFRVASVESGTATGAITGQTGRLTTAHVALLARPQTPFYVRPWFWLGVLAGGLIGYVAHGH
jgi:hypothetical protein